MRNLINLVENVLNEGVGLSNRKPGEQFANPQGDVLTFQNLTFYPESGSYASKTEADITVQQVADQIGIPTEMIAWTNAQPASGGGFGIAQFTAADGKDYYLGRWFRTISPNRSQNNFPHEAIPGGFKYQSKSGKKEATGYKPSEVLTQFKSQTPASILEQIRTHFGPDSDEARATEAFIASSGPKFEVPKGNMNAEAFRDYFCEMLQPMALVMGKPVAGNASEAAKIFFGAPSFKGAVISFNDSPIGNLYDSLLINADGKQIKLSSKGKDGAKASVVNLLRAVEELGQTPNGQKLQKKYGETIEILKTIDDGGHTGAPLKLAVQYDMITPAEAKFVLEMKNLGPQDTITWPKGTKTIQSLYNGRKAKDMSRIIPIEHMLAAIAYRVADYVNKNTNFSEAASTILNYSALVQIWTTLSTSGDNFVLSFESKYPGEAVTGVELDATKSYMSTQGKGNFVFNILRNGATAKDMAVQNVEVDTEPDPDPGTGVVDLDQVAQQRSSVTARSGGSEPREKLGTPKTLGRKRRE
jgi:hypothetical protein